jgi:cytosine/adenosine deaminase-related metal-dependent hydrolase
MCPGHSPPITLAARYVFPVAGDPLRDGAVTIHDGKIAAVGPRPAEGEVRDLGNVAILPGLVNAHAHLDFSDLARPLGRPGMGFVEWIEEVIAYRGRRTEPGERAVARGLAECLRLGTTAVGEIAQPGWSAAPFQEAGLDATVFLELMALSEDRVEAVLASAQEHVEAGKDAVAWRAGIGPHSPYTTDVSLVERAARLSSRHRVPLAFHLAESKEELQRASSSSGPLWEFLVRRLGPSCAERLGAGPTKDWLAALSIAHRALVIHGNYLDDEALADLVRAADRMAVVYCPRTHDYFAHDPYPLEKMLRAGITVGLGTDSRASSPDLSVLAEMRLAARRHPSVPRRTILRMATHSGAVALGRGAELGSLRPGAQADLAIVRLARHTAADPHDLVFDSDEPVVATWIRGCPRWEA